MVDVALPAHSKVIVWTAATHAAKDVSHVPGREHMVQLGAYVHRDYGERAFALGFTALGGSYAMVRQKPRPLPPAPDSSLETRALKRSEGDIVYLDKRSIRALGVLPARALGAEFKMARWSDVVDGLVVLRTERPPAAPRQETTDAERRP